jgi:beta-galactosidase
MIEYWHWHTIPYGTETYWGGILPHSLEPGRIYAELAGLGEELESAGSLVAGLTPDADVALLYSTDTKWYLQGTPMFCHLDGSPDGGSYEAAVDAFYRGAFEAGLQTRIVHPSQTFTTDPAAFAADHPVLVAAAYLTATDAELRWLAEYAEAGGHLVLGIRTGYADEEARGRLERKPAFLTEAAGVWYDEFATLRAGVPVLASGDSPLDLPAGTTATRWIDGLRVTDAEILASYQHPHFGRWPAVTTRAHGAGRVTYVGTVPDPALAAALLRWCAPADAPWRPAAPSQTVTSATAADGTRLRFVHNWSWEPTTLELPTPARDVLSGADLAAGDALELGPWDVRVLAERG